MSTTSSERPPPRGVCATISIHVLEPKSGESLPIFTTPKVPADVPILISMTEESARSLVRESLSAARANRKQEGERTSAERTALVVSDPLLRTAENIMRERIDRWRRMRS